MSKTFQALGIRQATWLELFFDLVFVAVIGVVAHGLAHPHNGEIEGEQLLAFFLVFVPVWWVWAQHTLFANRYDTDSLWQRFATLALMALVLVLSLFLEDAQASSYPGLLTTYLAMQAVLALLYFTAPKTTPDGDSLARGVGIAIVVGSAMSATSLLVSSQWKFALLYAGIVAQLVLMARLDKHARAFPVHRKHLIERIGLLAIIVLGETVIRIVGSFTAREHYDVLDGVAAAAGFLLIVQIWWIFFGALPQLERAKRIETGLAVVVSHLPVYVGIVFLANLTGHAINGDLNRETFAMLGVTGLVMFYLGKQTPYFLAYPPYRVPTVVTTLVCVAITLLATQLPRPEYSLLMMCFGLFVYVQLNIHWKIPRHNVDAYLVDDNLETRSG